MKTTLLFAIFAANAHAFCFGGRRTKEESSGQDVGMLRRMAVALVLKKTLLLPQRRLHQLLQRRRCSAPSTAPNLPWLAAPGAEDSTTQGGPAFEGAKAYVSNRGELTTAIQDLEAAGDQVYAQVFVDYGYPPNNWDVSRVDSFDNLFENYQGPSYDLSSWTTSHVTSFNSAFKSSSFNGNIGTWDISSGNDFRSMFSGAGFNEDISGWNTSSAIYMQNMFQNNLAFQGDLSNWDTRNVQDMSSMFEGSSIVGNIDTWNVSKVASFYRMFASTNNFTGDIGGWETSSATSLSYMFSGAQLYNGNIGSWNTSAVVDTTGMFKGAASFDSDIGGWDMSSVTSISSMFEGAQGLLSNQSLDGTWTALTLG
ncbi:(Lipo)protein [Seminavis robusta]|uniref:(Lipo)protein n=1 Tax=Seminavis robusta TaxID=568900 RepID=A0A9N8HDD3_9STRA|nr:(Lipo)protein [Seminavis robusta]|eukprot:Sro338_g120860.1 (Lipo)protein (367) ;mRNA; f:42934-44187